jgi:hypothetical protein
MNKNLLAILVASLVLFHVAVDAVPSDPFNPPSATLEVHVDKSGSDVSGTGTLDNPFLTIQAALASITDASTTKRYAITVGTGRFDEVGTILIKPWVWFVGIQRTATRVTATGVALSTAFTSGNFRAGFKDILFSGSVNVVLDLQALGGSGSTVIECQTLYVNNQFIFKGRTSADFVEMWDSQILGIGTTNAIELWSLSGLIHNTYIGADLFVSDAGGTENLYLGVSECDLVAGVTVEQTLTGNIFQFAITSSTSQAGYLTFDAVSAADFTFDAISIPNTRTIDSNVVISRLTPAWGVAYAPSSPSAWQSPAPDNVQSALDALAVQESNSYGQATGADPLLNDPTPILVRYLAATCAVTGDEFIMPTLASSQGQEWVIVNIGSYACSIKFASGESYGNAGAGVPLVIVAGDSKRLFSFGNVIPWQLV